MVFCMGCMEQISEQLTVCPHCGYRKNTPKKEEYFLDPGTILSNRYVLGRVLGNGGFGITYMGYDHLLARKVAIKEYFYRQCVTRDSNTHNVKVFTGDAQWQFRAGLDSFMAEARQLAGFTGVPEIADIYDCVSENGTGYIIMEYVPGTDVRDILQKTHTLPYDEAERIIVSVAKGLSSVHRAGIIHRDIAPDNIMIRNDGAVKLIDFGAARQVIASYSQNLSVIFKAGYAPVEQYQEKGHQGPWTDVYAAGATMYRMLTGAKPPASIDRSMQDTLRRPSELGVRMPPSSEAALMRSLAIRPQNRIQTMDEFAGELLRWRRPDAPFPPPGPVPSPVPPRPDNPVQRSVSFGKTLSVFLPVMLLTAVLTWAALNLVIERSLPFAELFTGAQEETEAASSSRVEDAT